MMRLTGTSHSDQYILLSSFLVEHRPDPTADPGDPNSNWAWFEKQKAAHINIDFRLTTGDMRGIRACPGYNTEPTIGCHLEKLGPSVIQEGFQIGKASDFWHLYEDDIAKAASLGTAFTWLPCTCMVCWSWCVPHCQRDTEACTLAAVKPCEPCGPKLYFW